MAKKKAALTSDEAGIILEVSHSVRGKIDAELLQMWKELQTPGSALRREAELMKVEIADLKSLLTKEGRTTPVASVRQEAGTDPVTIAVIIAFAPVGAHITKKLFDLVVVPRLQSRYGKKDIKVRPHAKKQRRT